jgi:hypothetical protein
VILPSMSDPGWNSSCVTVRRTISPTVSISIATRVCLALSAPRWIGPCQHQSPRRNAFEDFTHQRDRARRVERAVLPSRTDIPVRNVFSAPVLLRHFPIEQSLPHFLRRRRDINHVHKFLVTHGSLFRFWF